VGKTFLQIKQSRCKELKGSYKRGVAKKISPPVKENNDKPFYDVLRDSARRKIANKARKTARENSISNKRKFSTYSRVLDTGSVSARKVSIIENHTNRFITKVLNNIESYFKESGSLVNEKMQIEIEKIVSEELKFESNKQGFTLGGINSDILTPNLSKYIISKIELLNIYINNLGNYYKHSKNNDDIFMLDIINLVGKDYILNICLSTFLSILSFQKSDFDDKNKLISVSITMGKKMLIKYFSIFREAYRSKNPEHNITYSD